MRNNLFDDKKGGIRKLILTILLICVILIPIGIYASENLTNLDNSEDNTDSEQPLQETIDNLAIENLIVEEPMIQIPNEIIEDETIEEEPSNETVVADIETNESKAEINDTTNETSNDNVELNESVEEEPSNETVVADIETNESKTEINDTTNETAGNFENTENAELDIQIYYPEKITRGNTININATISNSGKANVKEVLVNWIIPSEFEIISGKQIEIIKDLLPGEDYTLQISVQTSLSTSLGVNQIKLNIDY